MRRPRVRQPPDGVGGASPGVRRTLQRDPWPGDSLAIPNRFRVFVFPKDTPRIRDFRTIVIAEYDSSSYPVSKELFSIRKGKLIAVGSYR